MSDGLLFTKDRFGFWGSFLTHLALLLILIVGTVVLYGAKVQDIPVFPGQPANLEDGTEIVVESFRMTDENGSLDYASEVSVTLPDGRTSGLHEIKVNTPLRMGSYKVYQQTYGTSGAVEIVNEETGEKDTAYLDEECFLTLDGVTGYYFNGLYPGYKKNEDGSIMLEENTSSSDYSNPIYIGYTVSEENMEPSMLFPGDEFSAGGITFRIKDAITYPGLRVKQLSEGILVLLYIVFAMMVVGVWMCFFKVPVGISIKKDGFAITSSKPQTGLMLELETEGIIKEGNN